MISAELELPRPWLPFVVAAYVALGILFAGLVAVQYLLVTLAQYYAETVPQYGYLQAPLLAVTLGFCLAVEFGVVATAVLVARVRSGRILEPRAVRWVDLLIGSVTVAGVLVAVFAVLVQVADGVPPGAMLFIVIGGIALLVLDLLLLVLRSLLRGAIALRAELDEVV
jgi:hypothetical protein